MTASQPDLFRCVPAGFVPTRSDPMLVIRNGVDHLISMGTERTGIAPFKMGSRNHVIKVWRNTIRNKWITHFIKPNAPWVSGSFGDSFEFLPDWMIPPDSTVKRNVLTLCGARLAKF